MYALPLPELESLQPDEEEREELERMARAVRGAMFEISSQFDSYPRATVLRRYVQGNKHEILKFEVSDDTVMGSRINGESEYIRACHLPAPEQCTVQSEWERVFERWVTGSQEASTHAYDYCCEGHPMTVMSQMMNHSQIGTCQILQGFIHKNRCCGDLATSMCITCNTSYCMRCSYKHVNHNTRLLRSPCPQMSVTDEGARFISSSNTFLSCSKCSLTCCLSCVARYVGMLVVENIPSCWSDGHIIEALEETFNSRVSKYERSPHDGHMYISFKTQVVRLRTQCIKLVERRSGRIILLKPPHYGRNLDLRELKMTLSAELPFQKGFDLMSFLVRILMETGLQSVDIRYAAMVVQGESNLMKILLFAADHRARSVLMKLNNSKAVEFPLKISPMVSHRRVKASFEYAFHKTLNNAVRIQQKSETSVPKLLTEFIRYNALDNSHQPLPPVCGRNVNNTNSSIATQTEVFLFDDPLSSVGSDSEPRTRIYSKTPPF